MTDGIGFTLAVHTCNNSDLFKLTVNLFSTLYTNWLSKENMPNIESIFIPCQHNAVMKKVLEMGKKKGMIGESVTKLTLAETITGAIKLLGGRPIRADECQYITEILIAFDLYLGKKVAPNTTFKLGSQKFASKKQSKERVLLPDGKFGNIGDQNEYANLNSTKHPLLSTLKLYKQEINRLGLSEKIPSIRIIYPHNNYGIAMMRTIVLQICRSRILGMIDDDDISCGLDSLHRIGNAMIEHNKYIAETESWWNTESKSAIGNSIWERLFDAHALKRFGIGFCPTFSQGEDHVFLVTMGMLFNDKFIRIATNGNIIDDHTEYPENIDLKYLYLAPSNSWKSPSITGELQKEEISVYMVRLCRQLGIYDALSKAIPPKYKCNPNTPVSLCSGYQFIHTADALEMTKIKSTGDVICPIYLYKLIEEKRGDIVDIDVVKDGDHNIKYIWAMPSPSEEETVSFTTNIPVSEDIKKNVIDFKLEDRISYTEEGKLVVTGKLQPRASSIDENKGTVSYNGIEMNWVEWNNNIYEELIKASENGQGFIDMRTKLHGGANRSYIMLILIALIIILLIIIPIICKCLCNKDDSTILPELEDSQL